MVNKRIRNWRGDVTVAIMQRFNKYFYITLASPKSCESQRNNSNTSSSFHKEGRRGVALICEMPKGFPPSVADCERNKIVAEAKVKILIIV